MSKRDEKSRQNAIKKNELHNLIIYIPLEALAFSIAFFTFSQAYSNRMSMNVSIRKDDTRHTYNTK